MREVSGNGPVGRPGLRWNDNIKREARDSGVEVNGQDGLEIG